MDNQRLTLGQCDCDDCDCPYTAYTYDCDDCDCPYTDPHLIESRPDRFFKPVRSAPATLSAWLHLTDRCNLQCRYCYLPPVGQASCLSKYDRQDACPTSAGDMPLNIGHAAIEATFRSALIHQFSQIKLKYAGGEPLLRFPFIIELHRYAQDLAKRHGLTVGGVILSNGTLLTANMVETMQALGLRLMISLDGLGESHDAQRCYANGRGSVGEVRRAIELALTHGLKPNISVTVSGRNIDGLPDLVAWLLARELPFSLNFYRENDCSCQQADLALAEDNIINGMLATYRVIEANLPGRNLAASLLDHANLTMPHVRTCNAGQSYLVFDPRGNVAKCQMQIDQPITTVESPDPLADIRTDTIGLQNLSVQDKAECQSCQWQYFCAGSCPLVTYRATGRYDVKSPNCRIYQALYPTVARLEAMKL